MLTNNLNENWKTEMKVLHISICAMWVTWTVCGKFIALNAFITITGLCILDPLDIKGLGLKRL